MHPQRNAQILEWDPTSAQWSAPHPIAEMCSPSVASTSEINSFAIHRSNVAGNSIERLFASTMPVDAEPLEGGDAPLCDTLSVGTVYLRQNDGAWLDTGSEPAEAVVYRQHDWPHHVRGHRQ